MHVVPTVGGHRTESDGACWCQPRVEWVTGRDGRQRAMIVHREYQA